MSTRKPHSARATLPRRLENADVRNRPADFSDAESQRVLSAAAGALIGELARQAARECFAEWLASRRVR